MYIPPNSVDWHYRKGTSEASNPTSAWRTASFVEDSTWLTGQTSIGYGDNDDDTILTDMQGNYTSIFMRRPFNVPAGQIPSALKVSVRVDDGCIIWINGVPSWTGVFKPGATSVTYSSALQQSLPTYHLIANGSDVANSQYASSYNGEQFWGTMVYNGVVFDHVQFNNRSEASTNVRGKNKWRIHFNTTRSLTPADNWGHPYANPWKELTINACASPWCAVHRGMSDVEEALSLRFYELVGLASPRSTFMNFRVIDDASETASTQYQGGDGSGVNGGDLWGLYLAVENPDKLFLDDRGLDDGNVYESKRGAGDLQNQGSGQPTDGSDWNAFLTASKQSQTEAWWRANMDMPTYYSFAAAIG